MESQESTSIGSSYGHHFDKNISRRSVDWRDSGIVIDEDFRFNSIDAICDFSNNSETSTSQFTNQCPIGRIVYDQDDDGDTILHLAVVGCTLEKVRDLIKICDLDAINNMMQTPLHVATMANRPEMIELLLNSGAKFDAHDRRGNTPLHLSCQKGYRDITAIILNFITHQPTEQNNQQILIRHLELTNFDGLTCLHLAALHDRREIIELLVNNFDANINCQDSRSGDTILHKAIIGFNVELVGFILSLNKHCNQSDFSGRKPLDTIKLLQESSIDQCQFELLAKAKKLVEDRITSCVQSNGCCAMNITSNSESTKNTCNGILDSSSSSSSDYSESDSDMS